MLIGGENVKELNRKEKILKLIVEKFVKTAEPVGSMNLLENSDLPYSSATIRNEMADLENLGYLEKTHTSSGRVPSSKGYRYYVDYLRDSVLDNSVKYQIQTLFKEGKDVQIDEVIKQGCEIISQMTNLTSVVLGPDGQTECLTKIQLQPLSESVVVAVFITNRGHVEHKVFNISSSLSMADLQSVVNILNDRICGTPINMVVDKVNSLRPILAEKFVQHEVLFKAFLEAFLKFTVDHVSVYGRANILEQPEFTNDLEKLRALVNMLEDDSVWRKLSSDQDIAVKIGNDVISELGEVSVVTANVNIDEGQKGTIALIGPTRMDYNKAIAALEYLQKQIDKFLGEKKENKSK